jgi:hypothetical protein|tara:strand:+ start:46 stop:666 length:621 start_codon:yes stop_codon:yes gene_type:complete
MAITYPLEQPTTIGIAKIELRAVSAVATSQSPFTYKQQIISHGGQRWEASVSIPPVRRDLAAEWKAMLMSLKGPTGTFLLGDPDYPVPRGTLRSTTIDNYAAVSGNKGDSFFTIEMTSSQSDTLLAGDYVQVGLGADARLYQILEDRQGDGTVEVWPDLRRDHATEAIITNDPKGVFRLASNTTSWSIDNSSSYGISFEAIEAISG